MLSRILTRIYSHLSRQTSAIRARIVSRLQPQLALQRLLALLLARQVVDAAGERK